MGFKIVREDGKTDWGSLRAVMYCLLVTWIVGVRLMGLDPFDDLVAGRFDLGVIFDLLAVIAVYLLCWHVMYPNRPKVNF
jgi:hypothetical protein